MGCADFGQCLTIRRAHINASLWWNGHYLATAHIFGRSRARQINNLCPNEVWNWGQGPVSSLLSTTSLRPARQDAEGAVTVHLQALSVARGVQTTRTLVITAGGREFQGVVRRVR